METNPGDIVMYLILGGVVLFILIIAAVDLKDEAMRALRTHRLRKSQRLYTWYARQVGRRDRRSGDATGNEGPRPAARVPKRRAS